MGADERERILRGWDPLENEFSYVPMEFARQLERELSELRHDLERSMIAHNADLAAQSEQLATARREMRERCAATAGKKSSWTYDPHGEDADYWQGYKYGRRDAETAIRALPDEQEQI